MKTDFDIIANPINCVHERVNNKTIRFLFQTVVFVYFNIWYLERGGSLSLRPFLTASYLPSASLLRKMFPQNPQHHVDGAESSISNLEPKLELNCLIFQDLLK